MEKRWRSDAILCSNDLERSHTTCLRNLLDTPYEMYFDDTEIDEKLTTIQKFYYGTNIFVTGATGFLGKILLNKLLTSCPGIETVYVLVRKKKNKDVHTRVEEIFEDPIFNLMKKVNPKFRHHIKSISGDCMLPGLGINSEDRQSLIKNVNIVFHMAATVRFDEKLKLAMQINVKAPRDVMLLCQDMHNLKSILHVSTAYTQCPLSRIDEKFYPPPSDSNNLILLTECTPDSLLENMTPMLLGKYPNTYTFTKAVAEDIVKQFGKHLPVGIFRPGIVISTYRDPVCGWIDNFYGPTGAIAGAGTGIIRTLRCDPRAVANMVPVDLCVNSIIAASWEIAEKQTTFGLNKEIPVYNFCTSKKNQLTWGDFTTKTTKYGLMYPTLKAMWYLCYANTPNKLMHMLSIFVLHYVPATIFDAICMLLGKKPRLLNTYKKIHRFMNVIEYFAMRQWDFQIDNVRGLWQRLSTRDKDLFYFNMEKLDWDLFLQQYFRGIRQYLLQDPLDTIPQALVRWNRLIVELLFCGVKLLDNFGAFADLVNNSFQSFNSSSLRWKNICIKCQCSPMWDFKNLKFYKLKRKNGTAAAPGVHMLVHGCLRLYWLHQCIKMIAFAILAQTFYFIFSRCFN